MMQSFETGAIYPEYAAGDDTIRMSMSSSGMFLPVSLHGVSPSDVAAFQATAPFQIRFAVLRDVVFFLFRFGSLPWMDTPYYPFSLLEIPEPSPDQGLSLHCALFDARTGQLLTQRIVGCGHSFSVSLLRALESVDRADLSLSDYQQRVADVYAAYDTKRLLSLAAASYQLR